MLKAELLEIMPIARTSLDDLDELRIVNYIKDILHDPEFPTTWKNSKSAVV
jgi:hypothetical protein